METLLAQHCARYPLLEVQDLLKLLHQSARGCGHLVTDEAEGLRRIAAERPGSPEVPAVEPIGGGYCRLHLSALRDGRLSPETFFRLFACSAAEPCPPGPLEEWLDVLRGMARAGRLPFGADEAEAAAARWQSAGYPACHHSGRFRAAYRPAYRVVRRELCEALPLLCRIDPLLRQQERVLVAVEGGSASGKTTLAHWLERVYGCNVFHMDDFFLRPEQRTAARLAEPGGNVDRERFRAQVLEPLAQGRAVRYQRYDCRTGRLLPAQEVPPRRLNVVEGAYSMHPELAEFYDLTVFLEISPQLQRERLTRRNTPAECRRFFAEWIPLEERYFAALRPQERCTLTMFRRKLV